MVNWWIEMYSFGTAQALCKIVNILKLIYLEDEALVPELAMK